MATIEEVEDPSADDDTILKKHKATGGEQEDTIGDWKTEKNITILPPPKTVAIVIKPINGWATILDETKQTLGPKPGTFIVKRKSEWKILLLGTVTYAYITTP